LQQPSRAGAVYNADMLRPFARTAIALTLAASALVINAQSLDAGVPYSPTMPSVLGARGGVPAFAVGGSSNVPVMPGATTGASGVQVPQRAMDSLNGALVGSSRGVTSPFGVPAGALQELYGTSKFATPMSASRTAIDPSTWMPGLVMARPAAGVGGTSNVSTTPAGTPPPGIPQSPGQ